MWELSANRIWGVGVSSFSSAPPSDARQVSDLPACLISGSAGLRPEAQLGQRPEEQFSSDFGKSETRRASAGRSPGQAERPGLNTDSIIARRRLSILLHRLSRSTTRYPQVVLTTGCATIRIDPDW